MMKKLISIVCFVGLIFGMTACGTTEQAEVSNEPVSTSGITSTSENTASVSVSEPTASYTFEFPEGDAEKAKIQMRLQSLEEFIYFVESGSYEGLIFKTKENEQCFSIMSEGGYYYLPKVPEAWGKVTQVSVNPGGWTNFSYNGRSVSYFMHSKYPVYGDIFSTTDKKGEIIAGENKTFQVKIYKRKDGNDCAVSSPTGMFFWVLDDGVQISVLLSEEKRSKPLHEYIDQVDFEKVSLKK